MRAQRVRCLPDEPLRNACVGAMSVAENIGFRAFDRAPFATGRTLVSQRALRKNARALIAEYGIRAPGPDAPIGSLSGGNVQRAVLARELRDDVSLLVASQPLLRPRLRGGGRDPLAPGATRATAAPPCC